MLWFEFVLNSFGQAPAVEFQRIRSLYVYLGEISLHLASHHIRLYSRDSTYTSWTLGLVQPFLIVFRHFMLILIVFDNV